MAAGKPPILIAHRGASGYLPEHTLAAYALAIAQGADYIEPDLVVTRDGVLVARHENEISGTTDVAAHPEFSARRRSQDIDGIETVGWFSEDFTLAELKTLRARERIPELRSGNAQYDGRLEVPTFAEILALLSQVNATRTQAGLAPVGVYPETKHPSHFNRLGRALEPLLLAALASDPGAAPVFIQSFEVGNLRELRRLCDYPLVQLMASDGGPWDAVNHGATTYAGMAGREGLQQVAEYANAVGVQKDMVISLDADGHPRPTPLVANAHAAKLMVHAWTFRAENCFLPERWRIGVDPSAHGNLAAEIGQHLAAGVDGLFSDFPLLARTAIDQFAADAAMANRPVKNS
jgi:glycerophosphoryl diester phosphodiesterase